MSWEPGQPHERPDPNVCPSCGAESMFQELAKRFTWQPVRFGYDDPRPATKDFPAYEGTGQLTDEDYDSFDYGDDVEVTGYDCRGCGEEWPTLAALAAAQRVVKALNDWADYHDRKYDEEADERDVNVVDFDRENREIVHEASSEAFCQAILILQGNGEA